MARDMRWICALLVIVAASSAAAPAARAAVKDEDMEFLHRMERDGFADVAVDYLKELAADPDHAPPAIMRVWGLEMAMAKREKARAGAYDSEEAKRLMEESKQLLEEFIKVNPTLPEAIRAAAEMSKEEAAQAQFDVLRAQAMTDKAKREALLAAAREKFEKIRPHFAQEMEAARALRDKLSPRASERQKNEAKLQIGEGRLNLANVDFCLALAQPTKAERDARFAKVAKEFDGIYREFVDDYVGWEAHYGSARILQEEGRIKEAKDYYEEVQVNDTSDVPDVMAGDRKVAVARAARKSQPDWEDNFFSAVERQYLKVLYATAPRDYYEEVKEWRRVHGPSRQTCPEFQGLTLDYARHLAEAIGSTKDERKKRAIKQDALGLLAEMVKIESPYKPDAIELRRQLNPRASADESFDGLVLDADKAAAGKDWVAAAELYAKALELAAKKTSKTPKEKVAAVRGNYVGCIHNQAVELYKKNRVDEAADLIEKKVFRPENTAAATAPPAAVFALTILFYQIHDRPLNAAEKQANDKLMARVVALGRKIIAVHDWTAKEEADAARIILLRVALARCEMAEIRCRAAETAAANAKAKAADAMRTSGKAEDVKTAAAAAAGRPRSGSAAADAQSAAKEAHDQLQEADRIFQAINPASHKYPEALTILGWQHWHRYRTARKAWEDEHEKTAGPLRGHPDKAIQAQWDDDRKRAVADTRQAVDLLAKEHLKGTSMSRELRDAKLLLAEMYVEGNNAKTAAGHYKELVDDVLADPAKSFDATTLRIVNGAVDVYMQLGDVQDASAVGVKLLELGPDAVPVNASLISFARRLEPLRKQADGDAARSPADQQALADLEAKVLINLAKRQQLAAPPQLANTMVWLAKALSQLGNDDADAAATQLIARIIDKAQNENDFDSQVHKYMTYLRSLSFNLDAKHGNYARALDDVAALIQQNPRALPPQMSRAQILTEWAARDPSKYPDAINAWKVLYVKLDRTKVKNQSTGQEEKMPEYYEAVYQLSNCLLKQYEKTKDRQNARDGLDFLTPVLSFDPKLQGKDRDRELVYKLYQLAGKLADCLNEPRPKPPAR